ncbi:MAG: glycosyl hydrolase [Planctomycetia bacterium]|nr:glycosyl hydrolase [Planctomycetia bacterium]
MLAFSVEVGFSATPKVGVYRWAAANPTGGAHAVEAFGKWCGIPNVWAVDFEPTDRWESISGGDWQLGEWSEWKRKNPKQRRLILSVPLLPGGWDRSGSQAENEKGSVSLADGARGAYNHHFAQLAENLVRHGLGDSILRLGWEMNGGWYTWRASGEEADFAEYFRQIVRTMRAVPGAEKLEFCWNPALGWQQFPVDKCYPGDEFVDYIGVDVYDDCWAQDTYPLEDSMSAEEKAARRARAWETIYYSSFGLKWFRDFAKEHGKPLCFPEWGVSNREDRHGGLDNPEFIRKMLEFIADPENGVAWHAYFDVQAGDGHHQLSPGLNQEKTEFPESAAVFRKMIKPRKNSRK